MISTALALAIDTFQPAPCAMDVPADFERRYCVPEREAIVFATDGLEAVLTPTGH